MIRVTANVLIRAFVGDRRISVHEANSTATEFHRRALIYLDPHFESGMVHAYAAVKTPKRRVSLKYFWLEDLHRAGEMGMSMSFSAKKAFSRCWTIKPNAEQRLREPCDTFGRPLKWLARVAIVQFTKSDVQRALVALDAFEGAGRAA